MTNPKVTQKEREAQTEKLYAKVGKIAVLSEHLNFAMNWCCSKLLNLKGLPQDYAEVVLLGQNLENMRRTWESLLKLHYRADPAAIAMITHLSHRIENIVRRRNDTIHRMWFIGWGNDETETYDVSTSIKAIRDIGKDGRGGIKYTDKDTKDFDEVIQEIEKLTGLLHRFRACMVMPVFDAMKGRPDKNFHYENGVLVEGGPA